MIGMFWLVYLVLGTFWEVMFQNGLKHILNRSIKMNVFINDISVYVEAVTQLFWIFKKKKKLNPWIRTDEIQCRINL